MGKYLGEKSAMIKADDLLQPSRYYLNQIPSTWSLERNIITTRGQDT